MLSSPSVCRRRERINVKVDKHRDRGLARENKRVLQQGQDNSREAGIIFYSESSRHDQQWQEEIYRSVSTGQTAGLCRYSADAATCTNLFRRNPFSYNTDRDTSAGDESSSDEKIQVASSSNANSGKKAAKSTNGKEAKAPKPKKAKVGRLPSGAICWRSQMHRISMLSGDTRCVRRRDAHRQRDEASA